MARLKWSTTARNAQVKGREAIGEQGEARGGVGYLRACADGFADLGWLLSAMLQAEEELEATVARRQHWVEFVVRSWSSGRYQLLPLTLNSLFEDLGLHSEFLCEFSPSLTVALSVSLLPFLWVFLVVGNGWRGL